MIARALYGILRVAYRALKHVGGMENISPLMSPQNTFTAALRLEADGVLRTYSVHAHMLQRAHQVMSLDQSWHCCSCQRLGHVTTLHAPALTAQSNMNHHIITMGAYLVHR